MIGSKAILAAVAMLAVAATGADAQSRSAVQRACWPAAELAVQPGEATVQRGVATSGPVTLRQPYAATAPVPPQLAGSIRRVTLPKDQKLVALTFDFCEQPGEISGYDGAIVDYLRQQGIKATLFMGGKFMTTHAARTQQLMTDPLFELAGHGLHHRNPRLLAGADLRREIEGPSIVYGRARSGLAATQCAAGQPGAFADVAPRFTLTRFAFGACNAESLRASADAGLLAIQWDISTGDPAPSQSPQQIADIMVRRTRPGSIILAHANGRGIHTAEALPLAIPKLRAKGYRFVTVSELLAAGRPEIAETCYDARPGDTEKYDTLFQKPKPASQPVAAEPPPRSSAAHAPFNPFSR